MPTDYAAADAECRPLTRSQLIVISMFANGMSAAQIARTLSLSVRATRTIITRARTSMGSAGRVPRELLADQVEKHVTRFPTPVPSA
ncbi:MAG: hypothetical protein KF727_14515 [Microbacteriaceae bacterium]|nr:hypothetical protein [Microbacteriaceae bacterium]